ncbi:hypothetical protein AVEN_129917-1 [Araneus ventricosus]|uniref:Uncharacterized protein n=1 Tax=Araneus ventricosus TaxID=182803 RepID=A0A4Y2BEK6_ARAVE|nr:hypothetical protein AVEN_129917-1 [Araneus ventricosus]
MTVMWSQWNATGSLKESGLVCHKMLQASGETCPAGDQFISGHRITLMPTEGRISNADSHATNTSALTLSSGPCAAGPRCS